MPKEPESLGWCQLGLSWLSFYIVTGLEYWPPRRLVESKGYKIVDKTFDNCTVRLDLQESWHSHHSAERTAMEGIKAQIF